MTSDAFRKLALALPGAEEAAHMNHPDFRVGGKIFATLGYPSRGWAMVRLPLADQAAFVAMEPGMFQPVKGKWGEQGATNIQLRTAKKSPIRAALKVAFEARVSDSAEARARRKRSRS